MKQNTMFKLHRHRTDKSGERVDFRFSHFHATQVPKGWDKLFVSIISIETGKTIAKSGKATVRNGNCQWTESLSESIWNPRDDASKELKECPFKFILAMGSARSSILGEAVVNLADYMGSRVLVPLSLPLKKCSHGTTLHVKIQCRTAKSRFENQWKETSSNPEDFSVDSDDMDNKSEGTDSTYARSVGSSSSNHLGDSHPGDLGRDICYSASGSHRSSDSGEILIGRTYSPPANNIDGDLSSPTRRQDSLGSQNIAVVGSAPTDDPLRSNHSSFSSRTGLHNQRQVITGFSSSHGLALLSFQSNNSSSKDLLDAAEDTIDELRAEAKMWERNARKLKLDLETLRKEFSEQSRRQADLDMELSAAFSERDGLKIEVNQLKRLLDESVTKKKVFDNSKTLSEDVNLYKELGNELKFQKESNSDLSQQLQKTQESNLELVSILQEMEETIEKQKMEIENQSIELQKAEFSKSESLDALVESLKKKLNEKNQEFEHEIALRDQTIDDIEGQWASRVSEKDEEIARLRERMSGSFNKNSSELIKEIQSLTDKIQELERDCNELTEENLELIYKMNQSGKGPGTTEMTLKSFSSSKYIQMKIEELEKQLKEKEMVEAQLTSFKNKCSDLEHQLQCSKEQSFGHHQEIIKNQLEQESFEEEDLETYQHIDTEQEKMHGVVTQGSENFELCGHVEIMNMLYKLKDQLQLALKNMDVTKTRDCLEFLTKDTAHISVQKLSTVLNDFFLTVAELSEGLVGEKTEVGKLETSLILEEDDNRSLKNSLVQLQQEKVELEEKLEIMSTDNALISGCLDDARQELIMLRDSMNANVSNCKLLEKKSVVPEAITSEHKSHVADLEEENLHLSERISGLEVQLRYLTGEKESSRLELEVSNCALADIRNEMENLQLKLEAQKLEMKQKLQESHKRGAEALEELEFSKKENLKLQVTIENYAEESSSLQKVNRELRRQREELQERCTYLESSMKELQNNVSEFNVKIERLEANLSSMFKDVDSKENSFFSEIHVLLQKQKEYESKAVEAENLLSEMYSQKLEEVKKLQREVAHLSAQTSTSINEPDNLAPDVVLEMSSLRADKANLENCLQEMLSKVKVYETEVNALRMESENRIQELNSKVSAFQEKEELLVVEHEQTKRLFEDLKLKEENHKLVIVNIESELKTSEYRRQQLVEDISCMKVELDRVSKLQSEIVVLKSSLDTMKYEKNKLEELLKRLNEECGELKGEKVSLLEKVSRMQKALLEGEEAKRSKVVLEEKLLRMECDLNAREALFAQDADLKSELSPIKRANSQFQRKQENEQFLRTSLPLEEKLRAKTGEGVQKEVLSISVHGEAQYFFEQENLILVEHDRKLVDHKEKPQITEADLLEKVQVLETKLADAVEANNMYREQLKSFLSGNQVVQAEFSKKLVNEDEARNKKSETNNSSLEAELRDLRERYFHMSLRFAEVEAEREDLVMKVKFLKRSSGKGWFTRS